MGWWLASRGDQLTTGWVKRFDPTLWTVNFPRPMMAAVTTTAPDGVRVDAVFYRTNDLAGLIWEAEDNYDHPLLRYETVRDFRGCRLSFRWRSSGLIGLDAVNGPTLTIEGRTAAGAARTWYVRLWNYASGSPTDAQVAIDFANLDGGFLLPDEADPVWAGDIDRMFISLVPPGYATTEAPLAAPIEAWAEMTEIVSEGPGSVLAIGDMMVPEHSLRIATGYDDAYNLTPARLLRNITQLGYRGPINHYVGMSHYFRLERSGATWLASLTGGVLNTPCAAWHRDFAARAKALGHELIVSLSYELFDAHCWDDWKQRAFDGSPALTGWVPPSTLLSPAHPGAMNYLRSVARAFVAIARDAGLAVKFQIGEPWWWVMADGRPCLYDAAARAAFGGSPVAIPNVRAALSAAQKSLLDAAGALLAASTLALRDAVRAEVPGAEVMILAYLPTVLDPDAPEIRRANLPIGWARPAFDILQLEDYDWVVAGNDGASARGIADATARLGYPVSEQHYLSGFVLNAGDASQWRPIADATQAARARGVAEVFAWALPQVLRDGFTFFEQGDGAVQAFDDIDFPIAIGRDASVEPVHSTAIVTTASGHEQRNADWANARLSFDVGPGVRSEADIGTLIGFFRARRGAAKGFRFRDPFDDSSNGMTAPPTAADQRIGTGDGIKTRFALVKYYGSGAEAVARPITRPVAGTVTVAVGGVATTAWTLGAGGIVILDAAPATGVAVTAGFRFDVPVRFAEDGLSVSRATFLAGEAPSVRLIEIREG
jgi:uncharacterized protein (TIGR02217 family)